MVRPVNVTDPAVWITEGPLMADVAVEKLIAVMIGMGGRPSGGRRWGRSGMCCATRRDQEVVIAFDQKDERNKAVIIDNYRDRLADRVYLARWDVGKGIDDAKVAGANVEIWPVGLT